MSDREAGSQTSRTRRAVLLGVAGAAGAAALASCGGAGPGPRTAGAREPAGATDPPADEEVTAGEDLMREHGVLRRLLIIDDELVRRIGARQAFPVDVVLGVAQLMTRFVGGYHERIEESLVFPRFEQVGREIELVTVLRTQHEAGRAITAEIQRLASGGLSHDADRAGLARALGGHAHMYRAHAAREDTVLFPALRRLVGARGYAELGEEFEQRERQMVGEGGFEKAVETVARLEQALGVHDLARFTAAV